MKSNAEQTPTFNLRAVVRETSIQPDTLRAWERRYGLPQPSRSPGGHRLYSQRDIDIIKWLRDRQAEGLRISRAVELWRSLEADGLDPLRLPEYDGGRAAPSVPSLMTGAPPQELRRAWVTACLAFDEGRAENVLTQAFALYPPESVCVDILQRGLAEIGVGWHRGEYSVQQEHFASVLAMRRLETLVGAAPPPTRGARILAACPPDENHTFSLLLLTFLLRRRGWDVVYFGANVPLERLEGAVDSTRPNLAVLSAQVLLTAASLLEIVNLLQERDLASAYGGLIFNLRPELRRRIPATFLGERIDRAPEIIESVLASRAEMPSAEAVPESARVSLAHYVERKARIEAFVWDRIDPVQISRSRLTRGILSMSRNIGAALTLGAIEHLDESLDWLEGQMANGRWAREDLEAFLDTYVEGAERHLEDAGEPIIRHLQHIAAERRGG